jgi:hypothetical protein
MHTLARPVGLLSVGAQLSQGPAMCRDNVLKWLRRACAPECTHRSRPQHWPDHQVLLRTQHQGAHRKGAARTRSFAHLPTVLAAVQLLSNLGGEDAVAEAATQGLRAALGELQPEKVERVDDVIRPLFSAALSALVRFAWRSGFSAPPQLRGRARWQGRGARSADLLDVFGLAVRQLGAWLPAGAFVVWPRPRSARARRWRHGARRA